MDLDIMDDRKLHPTSHGDADDVAVDVAIETGGAVVAASAVKPVLIKGRGGKGSSSTSTYTSNNNNNKKTKQSKQLKWDEQVIEEHDQLRGTRMKIDEPNTPYTYYSDSGAESDDSKRQQKQKHCKSPANQKHTISWDSLQNRLDSVANVQQQQQQQQYPSSPTSSFGGAETDASESESHINAIQHQQEEHKKEMRKLEFQDHRKRHYNEFQMIQKFRQEHPDEIDDDMINDDEDEEHPNHNHTSSNDDEDGDADVED